MSKSNLLSPLEVVEFYYNIYKDFEKAYEIKSKSFDDLRENLRKVVDKGDSNDKEFKNIAREFITLQSSYTKEVALASTKFLNAAEFYLKTNEEELSEDITKDYIILKNNEYKHTFSIKDNEFVRNSKVELQEIPEQEFEYLFDFFKHQFEKS